MSATAMLAQELRTVANSQVLILELAEGREQALRLAGTLTAAGAAVVDDLDEIHHTARGALAQLKALAARIEQADEALP